MPTKIHLTQIQGTNSYRLIYSNSTILNEAAAITAAKILKSDANGIPVATAYAESDIDDLDGNDTYLMMNSMRKQFNY